MNKVILMGRLTSDPNVKYTQGNEPMAVAKYSLAVDRRGKDKGTDFISCTSFGRLGEFAEKYLHKGTKVLICGRIQTGNYTDKDGKKVYTTDVIVENCEFAESKKDDNATPQADENFMNIPENVDDLPFK